MFETEVQAGIAVAEEKGLDWKRAVLSPLLDMARADQCVLGLTIAGGYWEARKTWGMDAEWMAAHGFLISEELIGSSDLHYSDLYAELAFTWKREAEAALVPA